MPRSQPFPSFFNPSNTWVITDVWDLAKPFTDRLIIETDTGKDDRWTTILGYERPEEVHPVYRIEENGLDIGWVVFRWLKLSDNNPYLFGYEVQQDEANVVDSITSITAFVVADSTRTDYRCPITTLTSSSPNVMWAITVESIEGQTYGPDPQPDLWGAGWSSTVPTTTGVVPITQYGINRIITFRAWMKREDLTINSTLDSCTVNFPAPLYPFYPQIFLPGYSG